jgi:hypothetical protein
MPAHQVPDQLTGHAGGRPGHDVALGDDAGVGKARLLGHAAAALEHGDFVALKRELVCRGDADDACADDGHLH